MRARGIKPSFFTDERIVELGPLTRLLFIGLWCLADREGRLADKPKQIRLNVLPVDHCDVDAMLTELSNAGFLIRYDIEGQRFIQIKNFTKHQSPHQKEQASTIPAPDMHQTCTVQAHLTSDSGLRISDPCLLTADGNTPPPPLQGGESMLPGTEQPKPKPDQPKPKAKSKPRAPKPTAGGLPEFAVVLAEWNAQNVSAGLPPAFSTDSRLTSFRERWAVAWWRDNWRAGMERVMASKFCRGENDRNWRADMTFFLRPDTLAKIMEGKYDDKPIAAGWCSDPDNSIPF